jgi:protein-L-isoaspartate O-methyltransferase
VCGAFQHAAVLEALKDHLLHGTKALDVGSGSGYLTVCMALMVFHRRSYIDFSNSSNSSVSIFRWAKKGG